MAVVLIRNLLGSEELEEEGYRMLQSL